MNAASQLRLALSPTLANAAHELTAMHPIAIAQEKPSIEARRHAPLTLSICSLFFDIGTLWEKGHRRLTRASPQVATLGRPRDTFRLLVVSAVCCAASSCNHEGAREQVSATTTVSEGETAEPIQHHAVTWLALDSTLEHTTAAAGLRAKTSARIGAGDHLDGAFPPLIWLGVSALSPAPKSVADAANSCAEHQQHLCSKGQLRHYYSNVFGSAFNPNEEVSAESAHAFGRCENAFFKGPAGAEWTREANEACEQVSKRARTRCCLERRRGTHAFSPPKSSTQQGIASANSDVLPVVAHLLDTRGTAETTLRHEVHSYVSADLARAALGLKPDGEAPWTLVPTPFWWTPESAEQSRLVVTGTTNRGDGWIAVLRHDAHQLTLERYLLEAGARRAPVVAVLDDELSSLRWGTCWKCSGRRGILAFLPKTREVRLTLR